MGSRGLHSWTRARRGAPEPTASTTRPKGSWAALPADLRSGSRPGDGTRPFDLPPQRRELSANGLDHRHQTLLLVSREHAALDPGPASGPRSLAIPGPGY